MPSAFTKTPTKKTPEKKVRPVAVVGALPWVTKTEIKRNKIKSYPDKLTVFPQSIITRALSEERLSIIRDLRNMGFDVKLMVSKSDLLDKRVQRFCKLAKIVGAKILICSSDSSYRGAWLRDTFTVIGKYRFVFPVSGEQVGKRVGNKIYSYLGSGGAVINIEDKFLLVSKVVARSSIPEINFLKKQGFVIFEMPSGRALNWLDRRIMNKYKSHTHIDLFVNRIPGMKILLVDPLYYRENRRLMNKIAKVTGYKILVIPEKERDFYPANFLDLGPRSIMMNKAATETIEMLRREGITVVPTSVPLLGAAAVYSGLRCAVNLPKATLKRIMGEVSK